MTNPADQVSPPLLERFWRLAALFFIVYCLLLAPLAYWLGQHLSTRHNQAWGQILSGQLAGQSRQALLQNDAISLQVVLDNLTRAASPVLRAEALSADGSLLAQSGVAQGAAGPRRYPQAVVVAGEQAGSVVLWLDSTSGYPAFISALLVLGFGGLLLAAYLLRELTASLRAHRARLSELTARLPGEGAIGDRDPMVALEQRIAPLLLCKGDELDSDAVEEPEAATLVLRCANLAQLQAHLTRDNFHRVLARLDEIIDAAAELYDGERLNGARDCAYLRFSCQGEAAEHLRRAIHCQQAISCLLREHGEQEGAGVTAGFALAVDGPHSSRHCFVKDSERDHALRELAGTSALADPWQLLVHSGFSEAMSIAAGGDEEIEFTALANTEAELDSVSLNEKGQASLKAQLPYLRHRLPEPDGSDGWRGPVGPRA